LNALLLFGSQFICVLLLVVQSINNNHGRVWMAGLGSIGIGITQLAAYRLLPGADGWEIFAFIAAGPLANTAAQWLKRHDISKVRGLHHHPKGHP